MKIGIFDSGLGGLIIAKAIRKAMPEYDYVYLGDTKRVPYGNRSHQAVFEFTRECVDHLFKKENCAIVIIACNTASARALRRLQREYLPQLPLKVKTPSFILPLTKGEVPKAEGVYSPRILGVLIPAAEEAAKYKRVGVLATLGTVNSGTFPREIKKISKKTKVFQNPAPMLVPLAEEGEKKLAEEFIKKYLQAFRDKNLDALVLGCTHYPFFKKEIRKNLNEKIKIISQDEIVPRKLKNYFTRHSEIEKKLSKNGTAKILITDLTPNVQKLSQKWFGENTKPKMVNL